MRERIEPVGIPSVHGGEDVKETIPVAFSSFASWQRYSWLGLRSRHSSCSLGGGNRFTVPVGTLGPGILQPVTGTRCA
jgi:hypothetical protein